MPSITATLTPNGPLVQVLIGVSVPRRDAMLNAGMQIPNLVQGTFLVDTGASGTCADSRLVAPLSIPPSGRVSIQTPSTNGVPVFLNQYDVSVFIPGADQNAGGFFIPALPILETGLTSQGIDGLIGRDIINRCVLIYNSSLNSLTLSY